MAANVKGVAQYQKLLLWLVLLHLALVVVNVWLRQGGGSMTAATAGTIALAVMVGSLVVMAASVVIIVLLMTALDRPLVSKILAAIAMIIPLIGLIVLLVVNQRATATLRNAGYRVGLMGARPAN